MLKNPCAMRCGLKMDTLCDLQGNVLFVCALYDVLRLVVLFINTLNQTSFTQHEKRFATITAMSKQKKSWMLIVGMSLLLLILAALRPLALPDEGRYADVGRWMLVSGDWLTPRINGIPFFHKPPLLAWLEAGSMAVFGVHAWSARLVVAAHAVLMLVMTYWGARQFATELIARRAVWMLATSLSFMLGGQYVNHDMAVAAWISVALWCFGVSFLHTDVRGEKPHAALARWGFAACAMGVLAKGLIGFALPGLVLLVWLLATRQMRKVLHLPWVSGLLIFCAIALPWFAIVQMQFGGVLEYLFGTQHLSRFTGKNFNNARPFWFYGVALVLLFFPWIIFVILEGFRPKTLLNTARAATNSIASIAADLGARKAYVLLWLWPVLIVGFFSIPHSKLVGYVLPAIAPLAVLAAMGWQRTMAHRASAGVWFAVVCALSIALAVGAHFFAANYTLQLSSKDAAQRFACAASVQDTVYAVDDFPYDFAFYAQTTKPMVVVQDWPEQRKTAGDNWRRELLDGAEFDAQAAQVLQTPDVLSAASMQPGRWLLAPNSEAAYALSTGVWSLFYKGKAWSVYQSRPKDSALKSPVTTQKPGLPGCKN